MVHLKEVNEVQKLKLGRELLSVSIDPDDPEGTKFDGGDKHEPLHPENKSTDKAPTGTELA